MAHRDPAINGRPWRRLRLWIIQRDGGLCQIRSDDVCTIVATTVDHVVPRDAGGTNHPANLRAACRPCNSQAGARYRDGKHTTPRTSRPW